jgi:hypothetical protein
MKKQKIIDFNNIKFKIINSEASKDVYNDLKTDNEEKNKEFKEGIFNDIMDVKLIQSTESIYQLKLIKRVRFSSKISIINQDDNENDNVSQYFLSQSDGSSILSNSFKSKFRKKFLNLKTRFVKDRQNKNSKYKKQLIMHSKNQIFDYNFSSFDKTQNNVKFFVTSL